MTLNEELAFYRHPIPRELSPEERRFVAAWKAWNKAKQVLGEANKWGLRCAGMSNLNYAAAELRSAHRAVVAWRHRHKAIWAA